MEERQKNEFFPVSKIEYKGPSSRDPLSFRYYDANEILLGKKMSDWLRFSVCFWHTFVGGGGADPFGSPTLHRPWEEDDDDDDVDVESAAHDDDDNNTIIKDDDSSKTKIALAKRRIDVAFELFEKLGVQYYTFHDFDVTPEGTTLDESMANLDVISDYLLAKQNDTGVRLLWATQNLFSNPRYMNGALSNPDVHTFCYAAAAIRKVMDVNHKLGGLNHVFWGGREGYQSLLNTNVRADCDHMAAMYRMAVSYKKQMNYTAQFLIEPKPREPTKHQYDYDAQTTMAFLYEYGLQDDFKLNIEPNHTTLAGHEQEHDVIMASSFGMLGSIDSNTGDTLLGWDTDQFPMDVMKTTAIMGAVIAQDGGLGSGGLNFDCKVRRESVDPIDVVLAHVGAMDCYARGLRQAVQMYEDGVLDKMKRDRYASWQTEAMGRKIEDGTATLQDCEAYAKAMGEPKSISAKQELYEIIRNQYM